MPTKSKKTREATSEYCPGSGKKPSRQGSKYVNYQLRYKCPDCGKHFRTEANGLLTKHGYKLAKLGEKHRKVMGLCAECGTTLYELDYLCPKCRED